MLNKTDSNTINTITKQEWKIILDIFIKDASRSQSPMLVDRKIKFATTLSRFFPFHFRFENYLDCEKRRATRKSTTYYRRNILQSCDGQEKASASLTEKEYCRGQVKYGSKAWWLSNIICMLWIQVPVLTPANFSLLLDYCINCVKICLSIKMFLIACNKINIYIL